MWDVLRDLTSVQYLKLKVCRDFFILLICYLLCIKKNLVYPLLIYVF